MKYYLLALIFLCGLSAGVRAQDQKLCKGRTMPAGYRVVGEAVAAECGHATAWVIRKSANEAIALAPQCTHLGCAYHWSDETKQFHCPCHTSAFSPEGEVLSGPAPRPLDRYAVKIKNNRLLIGDVRREA